MRDTFLPYGHQWIDDKDIERVVEVLKGDWITTGPKIKEFEDAICRYVGGKYGVAVNSGTSALDIAVTALELDGGEIITTPFTFVATANAILYNGLKPVFADIQRDTCNIDPEEIRKKITPKTRAIIYVDYAGQPCDIKEIREIADEHELFLIEDAAHALGAEYDGKRVGSFADITTFSFHPVKHITTGEGGMCVTGNDGLAEKMRMLRNHGIDKDAHKRFGPSASWSYDLKMLGRNYRMTDIQAALGLSQLGRLEDFIARRSEIAKLYYKELSNLSEVVLPHVKPNVRHVWHLYTIQVEGVDRDRFFTGMRTRNIGVNVHYIPVYKFSYYRNFKLEAVFPVTEQTFSRIVTLPLFPKMTDVDALNVVTAIRETIREEQMELK